MINPFEQFGFALEITKDGSPTLRLPAQGESMHHSGGAAAETIYIYGATLDLAHQILSEGCGTCIVGLGLGYIEIAWALSLLKNSLEPSEKITFHSFEIRPELQKIFLNWLESNNETIYDLVVEKLDKKASIEKVKSVLNKALSLGSTLNGDLTQFESSRVKWNVICYDAFSQKTNFKLWQEEFLNFFIQQYANENCVFTTYACTSILRKCLTQNKFNFHKRSGFYGKRESSLAVRGFLTADFARLQSGQTF